MNVKGCFISKPVSNKTPDQAIVLADVQKVNIHNNEILNAIRAYIKNTPTGCTLSQKQIIITLNSGEKYGVKYINSNHKTVYLNQCKLHTEFNNGKVRLQPINCRRVIIVCA